ncbi:SdiA-regulated domain-containing protein [Ottowia sp.]|uniref:SdiA-regulated domain-containing protein n=1 Tax=Ottowia sp. TaxID=1898956 RepID=UPI0025E48EDD|nr:SdiA-regulated domain-containing protein [Ottowia sp.]MBK6613061.1 SdiA-regulated domain-containing protein [Ottowia sp.]MBK6747828.1 SdiA-regulated domain-containing protein [Ottowia sp.]
MTAAPRRAALILVPVAMLLAWHFQLLPLAWHWAGMQGRAAQWQHRSLWLPHYRVGIEARPIEGLADNLSGLTYNAATGTLFTVINRPAQVAELTTDGRLLRRMPLAGVPDPEGIAHVRNDLYVIAGEREGRLHWVRIGPGQTEVSVAHAPSLGLGADTLLNHGLEGVSWDEATRRLFVAQEKWPRRVLVLDGMDDTPARPRVREWHPAGFGALPLGDLSSLTVHDPSGHLLLLSEESALLTEYAPDGTLVSLLPLWRGMHGLRHKVPQPEGVAVGARGELYIVSEPNLFYRFEKPGMALAAADPA